MVIEEKVAKGMLIMLDLAKRDGVDEQRVMLLFNQYRRNPRMMENLLHG